MRLRKSVRRVMWTKGTLERPETSAQVNVRPLSSPRDLTLSLLAWMKVTINHHHAVAVWKWELKPTKNRVEGAEDEDESDDDDDDVCGICRVNYDGCCPDCKVPGDECPLSLCPLLRCRFKWRLTASCSLGRVYTRLPHALPSQVARNRQLKATGAFHPLPVLTGPRADALSQCPMDRRAWGALLAYGTRMCSC